MSHEPEISIYLGGHRCGVSHLYDRLKKNSRLLKRHRVHVPDQAVAQNAVFRAISSYSNHRPIDGIRKTLLESLGADEQRYNRIVLILDGLMGPAKRPITRGVPYPAAGQRCEMMVNILYPILPRFFMAIRNPATLIPSSYGSVLQSGSLISFDDFVEQMMVRDIAWSNTIEKIIPQIADKALYVWRLEDYEHVWRDVMASITGVREQDKFQQNPKPVNVGMSLQGAEKLYKFLFVNADAADSEKLAFAQKMLKDHPSSEPPPNDHNNWTPALREDLTYRYEDDWYLIERFEEVSAISRKLEPLVVT